LFGSGQLLRLMGKVDADEPEEFGKNFAGGVFAI
jgi:hypothetical protein